jgi:CheY-like chemotaxis protein/glycine cleavage system H lipoate-binding protein
MSVDNHHRSREQRDILVVDDDSTITGSVRRICSAEGLTVDEAQSATAGFQLLERCSYRLIFSDIKMAGVDGFELLAHVAAKRIMTPVVMVTGYATEDNAIRAMFSGAIDFLPKPFTADEVLAVLRRGLRYEKLKAAEAAAQKSSGPTPYAPCRKTYRRLGHVSWVTMERQGTALVGACDPFMRTLGGLRGVELDPVGSEAVRGRRCAGLLSADGLTHGLMSPVSGRIVELNAKAVSRRTLVEKHPYDKGWLYRILPCDPGPELEQLISCRFDSL